MQQPDLDASQFGQRAEHLITEFYGLAGAARSAVFRDLSDGSENRRSGFEIGGVPANHNGQRSGFCADVSSGDRGIEKTLAASGEALLKVARRDGADSAEIDDERTRRGVVGDAACAEAQLFDVRNVTDAEEDNVDIGDGVCNRRRERNSGSFCFESGRPAWRAVPATHREAGPR